MSMKQTDERSDLPSEPGVAGDADPVLAGPRTRVVARVVDPAVREDGRGEPVLVLHTSEARERVQRSLGPVLGDSRGSVGHPVRERLLAKARQAALGSAPSSISPSSNVPPADPGGAVVSEEKFFDGEPEQAPDPGRELGFDSLEERADDLDLIGAPERRRSLPIAAPPAPLDASARLLLGTLLGIVSIAALFALLIEVAPHAPLVLAPRALSTASQAVAPQAAALPVPAPIARSELASAAVPLRAAPERSPVLAEPAAATPAPSPPAPQPVPTGSVQHALRRALPPPWRIGDAPNEPGLRRVSGQIGNNVFIGALQRAGISRREAYRCLNALRPVKDPNKCRPKDSWSALLDTAGQVTAFEYIASEEEVYQARAGKDGALVARQLDLQVKRERARGVLFVDGGFEASAQRAGFEPGLVEVVNKALAGYTTTSDMRQGDVLELVVQELTVLGRFERYAGVEALEYRSVGGGEPLRIYYQESGKTRAYVDGKGRVFGRSRWSRPVPGFRISSRFNLKRFHPILKRIKPHNGTDFAAPIGTPIVAASAGVVSFVGRAGPNGNMVRLSHGAGYETGYSHLSRFARGLRAGARVEQRQVIGYIGSTGRSTGPHLHFSAKRSGRFIDPESLNLDGLLRVPVADRQGLQALRQRYDQLLDELRKVVPPSRTMPAPAEAKLASAASAAAAAPAASAPASSPSSAPADPGASGVPPILVDPFAVPGSAAPPSSAADLPAAQPSGVNDSPADEDDGDEL